MDFLVLDLNSRFNVIVRKPERALFKVFLLSKGTHSLTIILVGSRDMRVFNSIEHGTLCVAETPAIFGFIEFVQSLVLYIVKTDRGSRRLDCSESLIFTEGDW